MEEKKASVMIIFCPKTKRFLCVKRSPTMETMAGMWSVPGGHIEDGESPGDAGLREFEEDSLFFQDYLPLDMFKLIIYETPEIDDFLHYLGSLSSFEYAFKLSERFYSQNEADQKNEDIVKALVDLYKKREQKSLPEPKTEPGKVLVKVLREALIQEALLPKDTNDKGCILF